MYKNIFTGKSRNRASVGNAQAYHHMLKVQGQNMSEYYLEIIIDVYNGANLKRTRVFSRLLL